MDYRRLGDTGLEVSSLGFGASSLGSVFRSINESDGIKTVHTAIDSGINYFDVSPYYGLTKAETVLGKALERIDRSKFVLSTKAGRYGDDDFDFSANKLKDSIHASLKRLKVDYVDILYLHDIEFVNLNQIIEESIPALEDMKKQGKIRYVGVSGLPLKIFKEIMKKSEIDSLLSYCQYSLNNTNLTSLLNETNKKGIGLVNASPLSMGLLTKRGTPSWHPASNGIKEVCAEAAAFCYDNGVEIEKLAIQFSTSNKDIPTTLVGTANPDNLLKNIKWVEEPINEEMLARILEILSPIKNQIWMSGKQENN